MAITDIPEFVEVSPGDLIRSEDVNSVQRQARNSVRVHRHTRAASAPPNDADGADLALQITTAELADGAVTLAKLADGVIPGAALANGAVTGQRLATTTVGNTKVQDGAVSNQKLQANAVGQANIQDGAVTRAKLDMQGQEVQQPNVAANSQVNVVVERNVTNALGTVVFPVATLTGVTGGTAAEVEATVTYRRTPSSPGTGIDVLVRLRNAGTSTTTVTTRVLTFAPFDATPYGYGSLTAIGGRLL